MSVNPPKDLPPPVPAPRANEPSRPAMRDESRAVVAPPNRERPSAHFQNSHKEHSDEIRAYSVVSREA